MPITGQVDKENMFVVMEDPSKFVHRRGLIMGVQIDGKYETPL